MGDEAREVDVPRKEGDYPLGRRNIGGIARATHGPLYFTAHYLVKNVQTALSFGVETRERCRKSAITLIVFHSHPGDCLKASVVEVERAPVDECSTFLRVLRRPPPPNDHRRHNNKAELWRLDVQAVTRRATQPPHSRPQPDWALCGCGRVAFSYIKGQEFRQTRNSIHNVRAWDAYL